MLTKSFNRLTNNDKQCRDLGFGILKFIVKITVLFPRSSDEGEFEKNEIFFADEYARDKTVITELRN